LETFVRSREHFSLLLLSPIELPLEVSKCNRAVGACAMEKSYQMCPTEQDRLITGWPASLGWACGRSRSDAPKTP